MLTDRNGDPLVCFECGQPAEHAHHVVPRSRGGKNTVPLCHDCHDRVHFRTDDASSLLRSAYLQAKAALQLAPAKPPDAADPDEADDGELEWTITASDLTQAERSDLDPEFFARLRAKIQQRR